MGTVDTALSYSRIRQVAKKILANATPAKMLQKCPSQLHLFLQRITPWKIHYKSPDQPLYIEVDLNLATHQNIWHCCTYKLFNVHAFIHHTPIMCLIYSLSKAELVLTALGCRFSVHQKRSPHTSLTTKAAWRQGGIPQEWSPGLPGTTGDLSSPRCPGKVLLLPAVRGYALQTNVAASLLPAVQPAVCSAASWTEAWPSSYLKVQSFHSKAIIRRPVRSQFK